MESICKLKDIYKALYNFEKEFAEKMVSLSMRE